MNALKAAEHDHISPLIPEGSTTIIKIIVSILLLFLSSYCAGQKKIRSLIVLELNTDEKDKTTKHLVSYNFSKGNFISKDTLFLAYQGNNKYLHQWFDYGYNSFIYKNRYAIGDRATVYDLKTNKLILDSSQTFLRTSADSLFFYQSETNKGGLWSLDLKTNNYIVLSQAIIYPNMRWSQDRKHYIEVPRSDINFKIKLFKTGNENPTIIPTSGPYLNIYIKKTIETYWLDNNTFLYANHTHTFPALPKQIPKPEIKSKSDTIKIYDFSVRYDGINHLTIFKYNIDTHSSLKIAEMDSIKNSYWNASFSTDSKNQLIYRTTNNKYYSLSVKKRKFTPYPFIALSEGFSLESQFTDIGRILKYRGTQIGWVKTLKNYINDKYFACAVDDSIWVWNAYTRSEKSISLSNNFQIIGWINR